MSDSVTTFILTLFACAGLAYGFDLDGYYLRQLTLILSGFCFAGVFFTIDSDKE